MLFLNCVESGGSDLSDLSPCFLLSPGKETLSLGERLFQGLSVAQAGLELTK